MLVFWCGARHKKPSNSNSAKFLLLLQILAQMMKIVLQTQKNSQNHSNYALNLGQKWSNCPNWSNFRMPQGKEKPWRVTKCGTTEPFKTANLAKNSHLWKPCCHFMTSLPRLGPFTVCPYPPVVLRF